jgi:SAM-dependent methyltransferase
MKIYRNNDVISGSEDLEHLYTFENFPVFMGCTDQDPSEDLSCELSVYISRSTGVLQINPILPLDLIYKQEHNSGSIGKTWQEHHECFAAFINEQSPGAVLEVGGGHGKLASLYPEEIEWTILEPNPRPQPDCPAKILKGFFNKDIDLSNVKFDTVVHSHVFEHTYDPDNFIKMIADRLPKQGKVIFSVPNMRKMLEKKYTNCLNFEHTYFLSEEYIEHIMLKNGFRLLAVKYFRDDNSIFYAWEKIDSFLDLPVPEHLYALYKSLFLEYVDYHKSLIQELNSNINRPYYLFGAHVFSQFLVKFELNTGNLVCILDNDSSKQGKRLYGTDIFVKSPKVLAEVKEPLLVLRAGSFTEEIKLDIKNNINSSTEFL